MPVTTESRIRRGEGGGGKDTYPYALPGEGSLGGGSGTPRMLGWEVELLSSLSSVSAGVSALGGSSAAFRYSSSVFLILVISSISSCLPASAFAANHGCCNDESAEVGRTKKSPST